MSQWFWACVLGFFAVLEWVGTNLRGAWRRGEPCGGPEACE
jgi:hypothetical protein